MTFYNRITEIDRLKNALGRERRQLIVVYGRRRSGKSTLLQRILRPKDVYYQASQTTSAFQIEQLSVRLSEKFPGLIGANFSNWYDLFSALNAQVSERFTLMIDELPYLVRSDTSLPSILQQLVDMRETLNFDLILCGSSQQMMRGMVLTATAPLYGRADEIIKVTPLSAGWLTQHLPALPAAQLVTEFATWGGIPRYWELRADYDDYDTAVKQLILSPTGVLREEPNRLLLEDLQNTVQSTTLLALVASGVHKISELGGRMHKPATDLSRPLQRLIEMSYLKREVPYGETAKKRKGNIYKVADPFMRFYYHYVYGNLSDLIAPRVDSVWQRLQAGLTAFVAPVWEELCQQAVGTSNQYSTEFHQPARWWGKDRSGQQMEIDLLTFSYDGKRILAGECKWSTVARPDRLRAELVEKVKRLPKYNDQQIETILFGRSFSKQDEGDCWLPGKVLGLLEY